MQGTLPMIIGTLITMIISIILLSLCLKYRAIKLLELTLSLKDSLRLSIKSAVVFTMLFQVLNITDTYIGWIMYSLWALIGLLGWIYIMQIILRKELIKESLDFDRAKKLAGSSASYFFWITVLLWILMLAAQIYLITK